MNERTIRDLFLRSEDVKDDWSSCNIWFKIDSNYLEKIRSSWDTLEPSAKMRYLLACIGATYEANSKLTDDVRDFLEDAMGNDDIDPWVAQVAGMVAKKMFGEKTPCPKLEDLLDKMMDSIIKSTPKENDNASINNSLIEMDSPYFQPLEIKYLHTSLQPKKELFKNCHFMPAERPPTKQYFVESQHKDIWKPNNSASNANSKKQGKAFATASRDSTSQFEGDKHLMIPKKRNLSREITISNHLSQLSKEKGRLKTHHDAAVASRNINSTKTKMVTIDVDEVKRLQKTGKNEGTKIMSSKLTQPSEPLGFSFGNLRPGGRGSGSRGRRGRGSSTNLAHNPIKNAKENDDVIKKILSEDNLLSQEEKSRIRLFFQNTNPTPDIKELSLKFEEGTESSQKKTSFLHLDYNEWLWTVTVKKVDL